MFLSSDTRGSSGSSTTLQKKPQPQTNNKMRTSKITTGNDVATAGGLGDDNDAFVYIYANPKQVYVSDSNRNATSDSQFHWSFSSGVKLLSSLLQLLFVVVIPWCIRSWN
jgi:hypothetical protein